MAEVVVSRPKLHTAQETIKAGRKRFNVVCNGRRWGKTVLAVWLTVEAILQGKPVAYFVPTFDFGEEYWEEIKDRLEPIIRHKNESRFTIRFINGATLKMWSLEKKRAGRSRKYGRVIIDEAAFAKDLKHSWERAIRATLADMQGDAYFLSTPDGTKNYFFNLFNNAETFPDWASFQMPTETNPYIDEAEIEELRQLLDDLTFDQEILAKFVDFTNQPFAYSFDKEKHVKPCGPLNRNFYVDLSFDFNVDPITCLVCQHAENRSIIKIHKEYRLRNSDIYKLCERILIDFPGYTFRVTGDASGKNRNAALRDNLNAYIIIKQELGLPLTEQFKVPGENPSIKNSRRLTNSLLARHPNLIIDPACKFLIDDLKYVETGDNGEINKKKDAYKTHLLDCFRYYLNAHFSDFIKYKF